MFRGPQRKHVSVKRVFLVRRLWGTLGWCWRSRLWRRLCGLIVLGFPVVLVLFLIFPFLALGFFGLPFLSLLPIRLHLSYLFGAQPRF